jgi:DNA polymerase-3 subunit gamma/tau
MAKSNFMTNPARIKVIGLGGGGCNAITRMVQDNIQGVEFIAMNTDAQALATTEAHKVLPTIMSRCQHFDFRRISQDDVVSKLTHICSAEGIKVEPEGLRLIARAATGSLRDAENLLEQLITYYGSEIESVPDQSIS